MSPENSTTSVIATATAAAATPTATAATTAAATKGTATTAAAAAAWSTVTATTTATATGALFFWTGFVDGEVTPGEVCAMEFVNGSLARFSVVKSDERKATGTACHFVLDQMDVRNGAMLGKQIFKIVFRRVEGQIAYI